VDKNSVETRNFSSAENSGAAGAHPPVSAAAETGVARLLIGPTWVWQAMHLLLGCDSMATGEVKRVVTCTGCSLSFFLHPVATKSRSAPSANKLMRINLCRFFPIISSVQQKKHQW